MPMIFIFGLGKKDENEKYLGHSEVRRLKIFEIVFDAVGTKNT